jgi:zinc transport system substrate-binding protein
MDMSMKKIIALTLLVVAIAGVVTYGVLQNQKTAEANKMHVAATFYPLYEIAKEIGGDKVSVTNVTPSGVEPHDYEPSASTIADLQNTKVFIYNGTAFEPWVDKFLPDFKNTAVKASDSIDLIKGDEGTDPHYWLDPKLAQRSVQTIRDALIAASPSDKDYFMQNATKYSLELSKLDDDIKSGLQTCNSRTVIASHDAFSYFAKRYNLTVESIAGLNPEAEPSATKLAEITKLVRQKGITYIFYERLVSSKIADTIATETGAKTAVFDPIEGLTNEDKQQGKTYVSIQRENLAALRTALSCQ